MLVITHKQPYELNTFQASMKAFWKFSGHSLRSSNGTSVLLSGLLGHLTINSNFGGRSLEGVIASSLAS